MSNSLQNHATAAAARAWDGRPSTGRSAEVIALDRKAALRKAAVDAAPRRTSPRGADRAGLAGAARAALVERLGAIGSTIAFDLRDGIVDLHGWVESGNQKQIAEEALRAVPGLRGVRNRLRVQPPSKLASRSLRR